MERTPEIFNKIEAYLNDELSHTERIAFEEQMQHNTYLKEEVEKHKALQVVLADEDALAFKKQLKEIGKALSQKDTITKEDSGVFNLLKSWKIAASFLVLIGLGALLWYQSPQNIDQNLYAQYYEPYTSTNSWRGNEKTVTLKNALKLYETKKYELAITDFNAVLEKDTNFEEAYLYLGNCYLMLNKPKIALEEFSQLKDDSGFYEDALWYRSLTYIKMKDYKSARLVLEQLINYKGVFSKNAEELITKLNHRHKE